MFRSQAARVIAPAGTWPATEHWFSEGPFHVHSVHCCVCVCSVRCLRADWSPSLCTGLRRSWRTRTSGSGPRPSTSLQASSKEPHTRCAVRAGGRGPTLSPQGPSSARLPSKSAFRSIRCFFWSWPLGFIIFFPKPLVVVKVCVEGQASLEGPAPRRRRGLLTSALPGSRGRGAGGWWGRLPCGTRTLHLRPANDSAGLLSVSVSS